MHIIIEGIDHCGKDTLINTLQQTYGGRVHHCGKPVLCDAYLPRGKYSEECTTEEINKALYNYQCEYFKGLFTGMCLPKYVPLRDFREHNLETFNIYYNRCHLGEYVYGRLYRNYTTAMMEHVFALESIIPNDKNWVRLILLAMHHPENREHDIDAFNNDNGIVEQNLFYNAFNKSGLNKAIIFVDRPDGKWRPRSDILNDVLAFLNPIDTAIKTI